jgi:hypothetical protein
MSDSSIPELMFTMLSLIFLLLGVVLIVSIVMSMMNPYDQIAFANTEALRAAIDQSCTTGREVTIPLDLTQNTPAFTGLFSVLPTWLIHTNGDPNYLLYYESFPYGQAVGWEAYQNMQNRLVTSIPANFEGQKYADVVKYVDTIIKTARENGISPVEGVIINNIMIGKARSDFYLGESAEVPKDGGGAGIDLGPSGVEETLSKYGDWKELDTVTEEPLGGDNTFVFNNYKSLNDFEKSAIKYLPCGVNSLCLKTRSGVYRFPLRCTDIKNVQLVYNAMDDSATEDYVNEVFGQGMFAKLSFFAVKVVMNLPFFGGFNTLGEMGMQTFKSANAFKISDFAMVSPCSIKEATISKTRCEQTQPEVPGLIDKEYTVCTSVDRFPIFSYDKNGVLVNTGKDRYMCRESIGETKDTVPASNFAANDQCIQIEITKLKDDYCWTPNQYKKAEGFVEAVLNFDPIREMGMMFFFDPPVRENSQYIKNNNIVVLNPTDIALGKGQQMFEALARKWWWGWP